MADRDFNIRVVTTADTTGIRQTSAGLDELDAKSKVLSREQIQASGQTGVDKFIAAQKAAKDATKETAKETSEEGGPPASVARLGETAAGIGRVARALATVAGPVALLNQIQRVADEIERTNKLMDEEGAKLVEIGQHFQNIAQNATTFREVTSVATAGLSQMQVAQREVSKESGEMLKPYQKISDAIYHIIADIHAWGNASADAGKISKQALDLATQAAVDNAEAVRNATRGALESARLNEQIFDARKLEPAAGAIGEISSEIDTLRNKQKALVDERGKITDVQRYAELGEKIEAQEKQLSGIVAIEKQRESLAEKTAQNLDAQLPPLEKARASVADIDTETGKVFDQLDALGVHSGTIKDIFEAGTKAGGETGAQIQALAQRLADLDAKSRAAQENSYRTIIALEKQKRDVADANLTTAQKEADVYVRMVEELKDILGFLPKTAQEALEAASKIGGARGERAREIAAQLAPLTPAAPKPLSIEDQAAAAGRTLREQLQAERASTLTPAQQAKGMDQFRSDQAEATKEFYSDQQYRTDSYYARQKDAYDATTTNVEKVEKERVEELRRREQLQLGKEAGGEGAIQNQMLIELKKLNQAWQ
jgi:hypothetical protein